MKKWINKDIHVLSKLVSGANLHSYPSVFVLPELLVVVDLLKKPKLVFELIKYRTDLNLFTNKVLHHHLLNVSRLNFFG